jgi:hypothetical protein
MPREARVKAWEPYQIVFDDGRVKMGSERATKNAAKFLLLSLAITGRSSTEGRKLFQALVGGLRRVIVKEEEEDGE